ncbi:MAG TPA: sodium-dependent bicarbonate transport family permease, partial [Ardenticatenaceae bacterium]|nr:sodium-dependent bicarbonate transport family permease [Ardenticatenaceae bacterium]
MSQFLAVTFALGIAWTWWHASQLIQPRWGSLGSKETSRSTTLYKAASYYLLCRIGLLGGAEIAGQGVTSFVAPGLVSVALSLGLFLLAYVLLSRFTTFDRDTKVSWAAHQGSVSVGTFAAAQAFLADLGHVVNPVVIVWLALMELPAILLGTLFLGRKDAIRQLVHDKSIVLLIGALAAGAVAGARM